MTEKKRYFILDEIRGFAIICMVFFHAFFTFGYIFNWQVANMLFNFFMPAEPFFAFTFIFISGICTKLTRSNLKRGFILLLISLALTLVTLFCEFVLKFNGVAIYFGVLHLLALSMLIYSAIGKFINKIPMWVGLFVFIILTLLTFNVQYRSLGFGPFKIVDLPASLYQNNYFFIFGFFDYTFESGDYFPLLPWLFAFLVGACFGRFVADGKLPQWCEKIHSKPLAFCGRHSLIIYLAHQPILYLLGALITA